MGWASWGLLAVLAVLGMRAPVARAALSVPTGPAATFTGAGAPGTANALAAFEAAVGGADNGTTAGEQPAGFRHVTWDGIALDGSDPGSTVIESGHVVALSRSRLEPWGIALGPEVAVANDGFASVNPAAGFTAFSPPNEWAPFNSNTAGLQIVAPTSPGDAPMPAQSRGLGVVFLHVTTGGTGIQYFNGDIPIGQASAPVGTTSFAGLLFPEAVVTRVVITLGTGEIFDFHGAPSPGPATSDLVAGDDLALAEPAPAASTVAATAGVPVTAALDTFTESTPGANVRATIDWGDGTRTAGTIAPGSAGSFVVAGNHAYAETGSYTASVTVDDAEGPGQTKQTEIEVGPRASQMSISCAPSSVAVLASTACTVIVADAGAGTRSAPGGIVSFSSPTPGAAFAGAGACILGSTPTPGVSLCVVQFTPGQRPPLQARISAAYSGDGAHSGSGATTTIAVSRQRCTLRALSRRIGRRTRGLAVIVTCNARTNVEITVRALARRRGPLKPLKLDFGTVRAHVAAGRPTVLVIRARPGVVPTLRAAVRRRRHVSLKLTLTARSRVTRTTTTARVPAIRLP